MGVAIANHRVMIRVSFVREDLKGVCGKAVIE
jgi:hypothetical protein